MGGQLDLCDFIKLCPYNSFVGPQKLCKMIRSQDGTVSLVIVERISVMDILDLEGHSLVGKFCVQGVG